MSEILFKAPNGETLVARDELQASAFISAGLEEVKETKKVTEKAK